MSSSTILLYDKDGKSYFDRRLLACIQQHQNSKIRSILDQTDPCHVVDASGATLLHYTTEYGNATIVEYLIGRGCDVNAVDKVGNTALIIAVDRYHTDIILTLIGAKASVLIANNDGESAAKLVLANSSIRNEVIWHKILHVMKEECSNDSQLTAKTLLEFKCPLNRAVMLRDAMVTKYMLDHGCDVNERENRGARWTALHEAVFLSDLENVKMLVRYRADANIGDRVINKPPLFYYGTKLNWVETDDNLEILKILLEHGASLDVRGNDGLSLMEVFFINAQKKTIRILMQCNVDLRERHLDGSTSIHCLAYNHNPGVVEELAGKEFDVNVQDNRGATALMHAVQRGNIEVVAFLLKSGAKVNLIDKRKLTALFCAVSSRPKNQSLLKNRLQCIESLLHYGADTQYATDQGATVLKFALTSKNFVLMKPVLAHLALNETLGDEIKDVIFKDIYSDNMFRKYFNFCKQKIELMKRTVLCDCVTLFKILTESDLKIRNYMRNEGLVLKLVSMIHYKRRSKLYYYRVLRKRILTAIESAKLRKTAVEIVMNIVGLNKNWLVANKIVDYFSVRDLKKLNKKF